MYRQYCGGALKEVPQLTISQNGCVSRAYSAWNADGDDRSISVLFYVSATTKIRILICVCRLVANHLHLTNFESVPDLSRAENPAAPASIAAQHWG
jgi:hypothetical protein